MSTIDIDHLRQWLGRERDDEDVAALRHARLMAATVARPGAPLAAGDALPPLWHWLYFLEGLPPAELGRDGHPARGGFLPPVPLPNRMWAGGRVAWEAPLPLGAAMRRRSRIEQVQLKQGQAGPLVFVTVLHEVFVSNVRCIREEHDIVYKQATQPGAAPAGQPVAETPTHSRAWQPDSTQLFRYSALTFNGHRIHYDTDYCRDVEGYADLVIHGPLVATQLAALAQELAGAAPLKRFDYRALRPALLGTALTLNARTAQGEREATLWAALPDGSPSMHARATW